MAKARKRKRSVDRKPQPRKKVSGKRKPARKPTRLSPARIFIYALALATLGGGGYLVYDRIRRKKQSDPNPSVPDSSDTIIINNTLPSSYINTTASGRTITGSTDGFPLKKGSRGARVSLLQQALAKSTPSILVDGIFGSQTASALKAAGYPETVDEVLFNRITASTNVQVVFNPSALAGNLYKAAQAKSLADVLSMLRQVKSTVEYAAVNEYYKKQSFIARTIVTDLLEYAFKNDIAAREQLRAEFLRIGLKVNSSGTWSLQGLKLYKDIITLRATVVIDSQSNRIPVRKNTILGDELEVANGMTFFRSIDNTILKVPTQDVTYTTN